MKISELPEEIRLKALEYMVNETDDLEQAFTWDTTTEGSDYWEKLNNKPTTQKHYDNANGSLYKFCEDKQLNSYEFEVIKRIVRCRKKGEWISDIKKTIEVLNLYLKEQEHLYENQTEKLNGNI